MSIAKEFREFAMKGNVLDLAVGVIIGGAFGKIVTSLVTDVLMPAIGIVIGHVDFSTLSITFGLSEIKYGLFIQSIVDFLIVAFCIFIVIKQMNRFKKEAPPATPEVKEEVRLLTEIRDSLKQKA